MFEIRMGCSKAAVCLPITVGCSEDVVVADEGASTSWCAVTCDKNHPWVRVWLYRFSSDDARLMPSTALQVGYPTNFK